MNGRTFDRYGRALWRSHVVTALGSLCATLTIAAMYVRHGPSVYFDPLDLFAVTVGVDVYLALASGIAWITHYPDHPATSKRFLVVAVLATFLAILNGVVWAQLPRLVLLSLRWDLNPRLQAKPSGFTFGG